MRFLVSATLSRNRERERERERERKRERGRGNRNTLFGQRNDIVYSRRVMQSILSLRGCLRNLFNCAYSAANQHRTSSSLKICRQNLRKLVLNYPNFRAVQQNLFLKLITSNYTNNNNVIFLRTLPNSTIKKSKKDQGESA